MMINALNSGASVFMADFEDATAPTWRQRRRRAAGTCVDAVRRTIALHRRPERQVPTRSGTKTRDPGGPAARLAPRRRSTSTVDGKPIPAPASSTSACIFFHNARALLERGTGPYFYLPKMESHLEARLWNDVFLARPGAALAIPRGNSPGDGAHRDPARGLRDGRDPLRAARARQRASTAGRWDYIFSLHQEARANLQAAVLPDRVAGDHGRSPSCGRTPSFSSRAATAAAPTPWAAWPPFIPSQQGPGGQRDGTGQGARGQAARGERRLRRHLGRAPRPGPGRDGGLRQSARGAGPTRRRRAGRRWR